MSQHERALGRSLGWRHEGDHGCRRDKHGRRAAIVMIQAFEGSAAHG